MNREKMKNKKSRTRYREENEDKDFNRGRKPRSNKKRDKWEEIRLWS